MITFTHVKCIRVQVLPSNGEKNCVHEILEYTSLILPKIVEVCMSVIMHVMGDKLIITLFHINSNMIYIIYQEITIYPNCFIFYIFSMYDQMYSFTCLLSYKLHIFMSFAELNDLSSFSITWHAMCFSFFFFLLKFMFLQKKISIQTTASPPVHFNILFWNGFIHHTFHVYLIT